MSTNRCSHFLTWVGAIFALCGVVGAQDSLERDYGGELPRIEALSPAAEAGSFRIRDGFEMQLVAAEPLVFDPIAMAFDERGRMYVVEMRGYSERRDEMIGAIRLLEDVDGDGAMDTSAVFADGLAWPTAVACYDGGVYVAEPPDVWYLKDEDGDGRAEIREKVYSGFGLSNVQGLVNSFIWSMDNRIHGATSGSGASVTAAAYPFDPALVLRGRDFSFDPRTQAIRAESGGAQHGLTFDEWGHAFVCHNSDHLIQVMYADRYAARNPYYAAPGPRLSIASDGPQADVFRISPVEPWRVVRTRLRVQGLVPGPIEGGGRAAGYFTSATGVTIYRGDAWPAEYRGNVIVGDVGGNLVHRKTLTRDGVAFRGDRGEQGVEFLASTDIWFRPVQFANAPDGSLYVADMYREVIEHPDSLPPIIKKHLDLNSGFDKGRIWRIAPAGFRSKRALDLGAIASKELVAYLDHPNAWHAETAQRLLWERAEVGAVPELRALVRDEKATTGRVRAMYLLQALGVLGESDVTVGLGAAVADVRRHAVRLAETFDAPSESVLAKLMERASDEDVEVRYQTAFTLGTWDTPGRVDALAAIARRDAGDAWMRVALLSSVASGAGGLAAALMDDDGFRREEASSEFLKQLVRIAGASGSKNDVGACVEALEKLRDEDEALKLACVGEMLLGAQNSAHAMDVRAALEGADFGRAALARLETRSIAAATRVDGETAPRIDAIKSLALADEAVAMPVLLDILQGDGPDAVRLAALSTLTRFPSETVGRALVGAYVNAAESFRSPVLDAVFSRAEWVAVFVRAMESSDVEYGAVPSTYQRRLQTHPDAEIRAGAAKLAASVAAPDMQAKLRELEEVEELSGDPAMGLAIFLDRCATCHQLKGYGQAVGPDLRGVRDWDTGRLVTSIAQPNAEINPQYVAYEVETVDGRYYAGILDAETATSVTLKMSGSAPVILKTQIASATPMEISLMPEDLTVDLDAQRVADLVAFLREE